MKKTKRSSSFVSICLLLTTAMIWGFAIVTQINGLRYIGSLTLNGTRFIVGTIAFTPVVLFFERGRVSKDERKRTLLMSLLAGTVLFIATTLQQIGIEYTGSAGVSGFITGLYTVFVPIGCFVLFRHKTRFNVWIGAALTAVGLFLLCFKPGEGFFFGIGEILLFIGSLFWAAHVIIVGQCGKNLRSLHFSWGQYAVAAVWGTIVMFVMEKPTWIGVWNAKWSVLYCGVLSVGVAYTLQVIAQKRVSPTFAAIILSSESVFSAIGGAVFGIDSISVIGYVGCGLIFAGIVVSQLVFDHRKKEQKNSGEISPCCDDNPRKTGISEEEKVNPNSN